MLSVKRRTSRTTCMPPFVHIVALRSHMPRSSISRMRFGLCVGSKSPSRRPSTASIADSNLSSYTVVSKHGELLHTLVQSRFLVTPASAMASLCVAGYYARLSNIGSVSAYAMTSPTASRVSSNRLWHNSLRERQLRNFFAIYDHSLDLRTRRKTRRIPMVRNPSRDICQSPNEAQEVWIQFFQDMEAGRRMDYGNLRNLWIAELRALQQYTIDTHIDKLPTLTDLERALRRVPRRRANRPDGIPGELCCQQPAAIACLLYPGLLKTLLHGHEPLVFKGGYLTMAYKGKGDTDRCESFRSLLVSNHLGKAVHCAIRQKTAPLYEQFLQAQQTGGRRGVPVQLAVHQLRAFCRISMGILGASCSSTLPRPSIECYAK